MGLFKDFRDSMDSAAAMTEQAAQMQQAAAAGEVPMPALPPVDLTDPAFAPIDGITLDKYAQLTAMMVRQSPGGTEETQAWLEAQGVKPGTWGNVQTGWMNRMATNEAVRTRYGVIYSQS